MATPQFRGLEIKTKLLYGIFATEKSLLVGYRKLVKRLHAEMLATKILDGMLPPEMIALIAVALHQVESRAVEEKWNDTIPHRENVAKFRYNMARTPAEKKIIEQYHSMGINAVAVRVSKPREVDGKESRGTSCYVHVSGVPRRPEIVAQLNHGIWGSGTDGEWYSSPKHGSMTCAREPSHYDVLRVVDHVAGFWAAYQLGDFSHGAPTSGEVTTLSACEGIEDAMQNWDAGAVKRYVETLGLDVVPFDYREPLRPRIYLWQFVCDR